MSQKTYWNSVTNSISSLLWFSIVIQNFKSHNIIMSARVYFMKSRGVPAPPLSVPLWRGGGNSWGGGYFNITSSQFTIHNNTLQSFVWSSIALKIHAPHFENWIFLFVVSLQKWLVHFLLQKRWRNEGFKGTSDMPHKWRVTWNYKLHNYKYNKKVSLLKLHQYCLYGKYISDINIYTTIYIEPMKI